MTKYLFIRLNPDRTLAGGIAIVTNQIDLIHVAREHGIVVGPVWDNQVNPLEAAIRAALRLPDDEMMAALRDVLNRFQIAIHTPPGQGGTAIVHYLRSE